MQLLNPKVREDIARGVPLRIELGSLGASDQTGFYGLDMLERPGVDIVANLEEPLSELPDRCVGEIVAKHVLEHISNLLGLMRELSRVMCTGGKLKIVVPHYSNPHYYSDPTHRTPFGLYSLHYFSPQRLREDVGRFIPEYDSSLRFEIESIRIYFYRTSPVDKLLAPVIERVVNRGGIRTQEWFERRCAPFFHASEIHYLLKVVE